MTLKKNVPTKIIVHHTADTLGGPQFEKVNAYHRTLNFPVSSLGYFTGYHYLIERDGTVKRARLDSDEGAHTIGQNTESIGIGLAGHFDYQQPTAEQKRSLGQLCYELSQKYTIPLERIAGHRTYRSTTCPGANLSDDTARYAILSHQLSLIEKILLWILKKLGL